jgi:hypothetical protein
MARWEEGKASHTGRWKVKRKIGDDEERARLLGLKLNWFEIAA